MAFSKKTIIKLHNFPIFHGEGRSNISRGSNFHRARGSNCIFLYKPMEFVIFQGAGLRNPAPSSGSARGIVKMGSSTHRLGQNTWHATNSIDASSLRLW